jgi:hypothetical protein
MNEAAPAVGIVTLGDQRRLGKGIAASKNVGKGIY